MNIEPGYKSTTIKADDSLDRKYALLLERIVVFVGVDVILSPESVRNIIKADDDTDKYARLVTDGAHKLMVDDWEVDQVSNWLLRELQEMV